jgi:3-oxoacyl-[acyl-carrier-protein] synthase-3
VVSNDDLAGRLETSHEWIFSRTGISRRHVVEPGVGTGDLALIAGQRALASAAAGGVSGASLVVLATATPDRPLPGTAPAVASRLGLPEVPALDVSAVCAGFVYAVAMGASAITAGLADSALVIGADTFTTIVDPDDRSTAPIFGDGAGAVVLRAGERDEPGALLGFDLGSDGAHEDLIMVPSGGSREPRGDEPRDFFTMEGRAVYRHAITRMTESTRAVLKQSAWTVDSLDRLVGHQANARILRSVANHLGLSAEQAVVAIEDVGNTSAASIPLALTTASRSGELQAGQRVALTAFGGGLTWGSATLVWPELAVRPEDPAARYAA